MKRILLAFVLLAQLARVTSYAQQAGVKTGYAPVNGLKLYYEVHGEGEPLVLVHGSFMTIPSNWERIIPLFKNRKLIVAEMQGHGRTADISRELSYEGMADDISGLLKVLEIDSADVLGYSMGGGVAFQMGIRHPQQVKKLIILSGVYKHDGWWPEVEESFDTINAEMFKGSPIEQAYDSLSPHPEKFEEFVSKTMSIDLKPYDWTEEVRQMNIPIFMLLGDSDGIRYDHAAELMRMKGGAKMGDFGEMSTSRMAILPATTHIGIMDRVTIWVPLVEEFLEGKPDHAPMEW
ncbi:alpha/beta hydrolase [Olivibacter sp. SDN3]|uniref:alpha/beta fold hydrolase n=1 Tax=Olivibacter sp. SDN3 TaxID=2764720 RepID=UPI0016512679|nr:alpha/beta hydrolase [Olivibacter sp. SDN3]QNL51985.1 alpha/beta hydrolase [Olivibacter sp. SDN3]